MTVLVFLLMLLVTAPAWAATCTVTAPTNAQIDVQNTIDAIAAPGAGQVVCIPNGTVTWTGQLVITKWINLQPQTVGTPPNNLLLHITNNNSALTSLGDLISVTESTAGSIRIEGIDFISGTGPDTQTPIFHIDAFPVTNGRPVLIVGNNFNLTNGGNAMGFKMNRGVVSGNYARSVPFLPQCNNGFSFVRHKPISLSTSWTTPSKFGSADTNGDQNLYIETNNVTDVFEAIDVDSNGRAVIRRNTFIDGAGTLTHGIDTSPSGSGRSMDVDTNVWQFTGSAKCFDPVLGPLPSNVFSLNSTRGGTTLLHGNTIPSTSSQAWGNPSQVYIALENLRRNAGLFPCWNQGYPAPYQSGWGFITGATQAGNSGVFQDSEPIYIWNNVGAGNYNSPNVSNFSPDQCGGGPDIGQYVVLGRDYFVNTPKPGYASFTYPHPLLGGTGATPPGTPTNLTVF
jgi:hypothetical protein